MLLISIAGPVLGIAFATIAGINAWLARRGATLPGSAGKTRRETECLAQQKRLESSPGGLKHSLATPLEDLWR
jgi:hypothetical protein